MAKIEIHTLNARGYILFDILKNHYRLTPQRLHQEIVLMFDAVVSILLTKGVAYSELRSSLTPTLERDDICLFFDSTLVGNSWYGLPIFNEFFPLLNIKSNHSILCGDLIFSDEKLAYHFLKESIKLSREYTYRHSSEIYCIYISNITQESINLLQDKLKNLPYYIGYAPMTFASGLKMILANCLVNSCIKLGNRIICAHEDDRPNDENMNLSNLPYEEFGYNIVSIQSLYFSPMLSYKIECPVLPGSEIDSEMSLNSMGIEIKNLAEMDIVIDDRKLGYLHREKLGILQLAGLDGLTTEQLASQIKDRIDKNYIYNMVYLEEFNVMKFNIMLEFPHRDGGYPARAVAALEYIPEENSLRLLTLV